MEFFIQRMRDNRRWTMMLIVLLGVLSPRSSQAATLGEVCLKESCVKVEVVSTTNEMRRGLMFRQQLGANSGMLFRFPVEAVYPFWMKNTLIPLDMIWIDNQGKIIDVKADVQPCKEDPCQVYEPAGVALYVLEVNTGYAAKHGLVIGSQLDLRIKRADSTAEHESK